MQQLLKEVLSLAEGNVTWLDHAALHFEHFAAHLHEDEKARWELLAAVYRERVRVVQHVAGKVRQSLATNGSSDLESQDT
jgi:hypothetical protein